MVEAIEATVANATETNEKAVIQVLVEVPEDLAEVIEVDPTEAEAVKVGVVAKAAGVECALNAEVAIEDLVIFMTVTEVRKIASMGMPMTSPLLVLLRPQLRPTPLRLPPPLRCNLWLTPMATKATMNLVESIIGITP